MPTFTPPTVLQSTGGSFWGRYSIPVGQSVVRMNGQFRTTPYPWIGELQAAGAEGADWFLGGRTYVVDDDVADELVAAGYFCTDNPGYGEDPYGDGPFGG